MTISDLGLSGNLCSLVFLKEPYNSSQVCLNSMGWGYRIARSVVRSYTRPPRQAVATWGGTTHRLKWLNRHAGYRMSCSCGWSDTAVRNTERGAVRAGNSHVHQTRTSSSATQSGCLSALAGFGILATGALIIVFIIIGLVTSHRNSQLQAKATFYWAETGAKLASAPTFFSCPSTSFCVGLNGGDVVVSTSPIKTKPTWTTTHITNNTLTSIACPSRNFCVATDDNDDVLVSSDPGAVSPIWTVIGLNGSRSTSGIPCSTDPGACELSSISCPTSSFCGAIDARNGVILLSTHPSSQSWLPIQLPPTSEFSGSPQLTALSCPTSMYCVATDNSGDVFVSTDPTGGKNAWVLGRDVFPSSIGMGVLLECPSVSLCLAANENGDTTIWSSSGLRTSAASWSSEDLSNVFPPSFFGPSIQAISCSTSKLCAVEDDSSAVATSIDPGNGGSWAGSQLGNLNISSLSCPSTRVCIGVSFNGAEIVGRLFTSQ